MNTYPADERRISEVERGLTWNATLPCPPDKIPAVGDSLIFALAISDVNREPCFVNGGDSVRVTITEVTDLATTDPTTGQALFRLSWEPLGQHAPQKPAGKTPAAQESAARARARREPFLAPTGGSMRS